MKTSISAPMNKITTASIIRFNESCIISQNLPEPISCLITPIEMIPPASAAIK